jgi:hypothetical protein
VITAAANAMTVTVFFLIKPVSRPEKALIERSVPCKI